MRGAYSTHGKDTYNFFFLNMKGRYDLEDPGVDGKVTL